ncbi:hypothetical protein CAEBREN_09643 [Caenorhabditis brenneri]|uniref:Uncharacterized protein n=1 Tax=Caenorhabditis brenneri TaxID=135651 RepID=G0MY68_CAEBE|nr:hypothetical protein CAEBREN_09643 [Caenorhabditis brenneri]
MSGYPYNNPHQTPNQNGASSSGYYHHPQGTQPPMNQQYYVQGQPNMQYQHTQAPYSMPVQVGIRPGFLPGQRIDSPDGRLMSFGPGPAMGFGQMGQGMVPSQAEMNMGLPHQQPQMDHSQQNMSMGQSDQMNNTFAGFGAQQPRQDRQNMRQQPPQRNGPRRQEARSRSHVTGRQNKNVRDGDGVQFSNDLYQQLRRQSPLDRNVIVDNNMMYNLLCGLTSDMVELQKSLEYVQGQLAQSKQSDQGSSNGEPSVQVPGPLDSTDHENISEDSGNGETQTTKMNGDRAPKRSKAAPGVQQITTESNELVGNTNTPKEFASEETARREMISEHVSTVEHAKVTSTDNVTPTAPTKQENFTKAQYSDVAQIAAVSSQPTSSSQPITRMAVKATSPPKRTAENMPVKRTDPIAPPKPSVTQAVEKPTDGFEFPKPRKTAPATPATNDDLKKAFAPGKAASPLPMVPNKKETPSSTPSKEKNPIAKGGSSKKKTPKPSPNPKDQDEEYDESAQIQQQLNEFDQEMRQRLKHYTAILSEINTLEMHSTENCYNLLFDQISAYFQQGITFDEEKVPRYLASRIESYASKTDLKSQKMRVFLTLLNQSTNEIIQMDSMFLSAGSASRNEQELKEFSYLNMIIESAVWLPVRYAAEPSGVPRENILLELTDKTTAAINQYADVIEKCRLWNAAFLKAPAQFTLQTEIDNFLTVVDKSDQTLRNKAAGKMEDRIAFHSHFHYLSGVKLHTFYTLLSGMVQRFIFDDILFLFSEDRDVFTQCTLETCYYAMVMNPSSWKSMKPFEISLTRPDFAGCPIKLKMQHLDGFIDHINGQRILRLKLDENGKEYERMRPFEMYVYKAFEASDAWFNDLPKMECLEFLKGRIRHLRTQNPQTDRIKLLVKLYEFLILWDSSIIRFDAHYFKKCMEAPDSVDQRYVITDDDMFLTQVFRLEF